MSIRYTADEKAFYSQVLNWAKENGSIRERLAVRSLRLFPGRLRQLQDTVVEELTEQYDADPTKFGTAVWYGDQGYGINWDGLANFLKEILPIVLPILLKLLGL